MNEKGKSTLKICEKKLKVLNNYKVFSEKYYKKQYKWN